jgi:hypothetical protein
VWGDGFRTSDWGCFYVFQWALAVIGLKEIWGVNLCGWLPSVVAFGVSFPFDQVLQRSGSSLTSVADDALDFKLFFAINQIRRWAREVWSVSGRFLIRRKE